MRRQRGFTLIEIAIGMAILGLGVVSALEVFGSAVRVARISARRTEAIMHAKALMDSSLWAATAQRDLAEILRLRGRAEDEQRASDEEARAIEIGTALGAHRLTAISR